MRLSDFRVRVEHALGPHQGPMLLRDHVLPALGGLTAEQALAGGHDVRGVWEALCDDLSVPETERWGPDEP